MNDFQIEFQNIWVLRRYLKGRLRQKKWRKKSSDGQDFCSPSHQNHSALIFLWFNKNVFYTCIKQLGYFYSIFLYLRVEPGKKIDEFQANPDQYVPQTGLHQRVAPPLICFLLVRYYVLKVQISACPHSKIHSGNPNQLTKAVRQCKIILINKFP